jgi:SAM-dependent methyltransferase
MTKPDPVRQHYAAVAAGAAGCCGGACADSARLGYADDDVRGAPAGADLGLGCGNPQAIAELQPGERVLDLGSGAGFDCFLAARQVGPRGLVIGVDKTPEMVARARDNAVRAGAGNVEFRLGEVERLPVADRSVDVILSNCVLNLVADKRAAFTEAWRVLAPGGRLAILDVVKLAPLPSHLGEGDRAMVSCTAGAATVGEIESMLRAAGFADVTVEPRPESAAFIRDWAQDAERYLTSAVIRASRPRTAGCCS